MTEDPKKPDAEPDSEESKKTGGSPDPPEEKKQEETPPTLDSLSILGVDGASDEDDFPVWHDPMLTLDERMDLAYGQGEFSAVYAALGQTDCTSCGYPDCRSYAEALHGKGEGDKSLCIPGGEETEEKLHELLDEEGGSEEEASENPS